MFFATSRLGSRKNPTESYHNPIVEATDELTHPSRVLFMNPSWPCYLLVIELGRSVSDLAC
ncbi:MAG: hypothetical protein EBS83_13200 [Planctomycetia bacterium]|nr:hypothetical protein [Planctomycetia bacterium]